MANESMTFIERISDIVNSVTSRFLSEIIIAIIILLIGFIVGRVLGRMTEKVLSEVEVNKILKRAANVRFNLESLIAHGVTYFIYFIAVIMALNELGLTATILYIISTGIILLIIVSIALGIKDFFPNMISGFFIYQKHLIDKGDKIEVKGTKGTVMSISLVETTIKTKSGDILYIPNSVFTKEEFKKLKK